MSLRFKYLIVGTALSFLTFRRKAFRRMIYTHCFMAYTFCPEWINALSDNSFEDPRSQASPEQQKESHETPKSLIGSLSSFS